MPTCLSPLYHPLCKTDKDVDIRHEDEYQSQLRSGLLVT